MSKPEFCALEHERSTIGAMKKNGIDFFVGTIQ